MEPAQRQSARRKRTTTYPYKGLYLSHNDGVIPFSYPSPTPPPRSQDELEGLMDEFRGWAGRLGHEIPYPDELVRELDETQIDGLLSDSADNPVDYFFLDAKEIRGERFFDKEELIEFSLIGANGLMYLFTDAQRHDFIVAEGIRGIRELFERVKTGNIPGKGRSRDL